MSATKFAFKQEHPFGAWHLNRRRPRHRWMTSFGRDASGFTDARRRDSMGEISFDFFDPTSGSSTTDVPVGGRSIREESAVDREPLTMTQRE